MPGPKRGFVASTQPPRRGPGFLRLHRPEVVEQAVDPFGDQPDADRPAAQLLQFLQRRAQRLGHLRLGVDPGLLDPQQRAVHAWRPPGSSTSPTSASNAALRVNQPQVSKLGASGQAPARLTAPWLGRMPNRPQ